MPPVYDSYLRLEPYYRGTTWLGEDDDVSYGVDTDSWKLEYGLPYHWDDEVRQWVPIS